MRNEEMQEVVSMFSHSEVPNATTNNYFKHARLLSD